MQLISKYNKGITYLLCAIGRFSKYAWVVPLKGKKGVTVVNAFQSILNDSKRKPNKNKSFKKWLEDNDIKMYSTYNEGKSVVLERFIKTLKNKIFKHMSAVSKNVYFDVLDDIVDKCNNTYHRTTKMKPIDVKCNSYAEYNVDSNEKDPKYKIGDHVRISKYIFAKGYIPNWSEEVFVINKIKNTVPWTYVINAVTVKKLLELFIKKNCRRQIKKNLE